MKTTGITLIVFGLCAIVMTIVLTIRRNRKYSVPVTARCIRVEERYLPMEGNQRAGVFEYELEGNKHTVKGTYAKYGYARKGEERIFLINPNNEEEFFDTKSNQGIGKAVISFSIVMIVIVIIMIYAGNVMQTME